MTAGLASLAILLGVGGLILGAWVFATAALSVGSIGAVTAWGVRGAARKLATSAPALWAVAALEVLICLPAGIVMIAAAGTAQANAGTPTNAGTDGPFADGGVAAIGLAGYVYSGGAVVTLIALGSLVGRRMLGLRRS